MKLKTKARFLLLLNIVTLTSCKSNDLNDYSLYYSYIGEGKGLEVYCWKKEASRYSGLLPGTNRLKTVYEVERLQDNLPCPINKMCEILDTILEEYEKNIVLFIL